MMKRKIAVLSMFFTAMLFCVSCQTKQTVQNDAIEKEFVKPEKITILTNSFKPKEEGLNAFLQKYKDMTGIDLAFSDFDSKSYYEKVIISIACEEDIDVYEVGGIYYPNFAAYDLLWDMTDTYEKSSIKDNLDNLYVDALRINGRLYGFPTNKGNGTVTYVRKDILDELGIKEPDNYDEFYQMLVSFKNYKEGFIPITAAGLLNSESPFDLYLREFYQNAKPDIYFDGKAYVDGMTEPEMREALERMKKAYNEGLIDPNIATNKTSDCRDSLFNGNVGCFNYWAGSWARTLNEKIEETLPESGYYVTPLKPIKETQYIERPPIALVIPKVCKNPEGVFKYLIEFSHDSGEGEMLFTQGVEGFHWQLDADGNGSIIQSENKISNSWFTPELTFTNFKNPIKIDPKVVPSLELFKENSSMAPVPTTSKKVGGIITDLDTTRREIIEEIVTTDMTIDEGLEDYNIRASKLVERILNDLNSNQ